MRTLAAVALMAGPASPEGWTRLFSPPGCSLPRLGCGATRYAVWDGKLVVGGVFRQIGTLVTDQVAWFDGERWQPFGPGVAGGSAGVAAIVELDGELVIGGGFSESGGQELHNVARWDGTASGGRCLPRPASTTSFGHWSCTMESCTQAASSTRLMARSSIMSLGGTVWPGKGWVMGYPVVA